MCFKLDLPAPLILKAPGIANDLIEPTVVPSILILQFCSSTPTGLVWFGLVWFGSVWFGLAWFGLVWFPVFCKNQIPVIPSIWQFFQKDCIDSGAIPELGHSL